MKGIYKVIAWIVLIGIIALVLYLALITGLERQADILEAQKLWDSKREAIEKICLNHYDYYECLDRMTGNWKG